MDDSINKVVVTFDAQVESTGSALRLEIQELKTQNHRLSLQFTTLHDATTRQTELIAFQQLRLTKAKSNLNSLINVNKTMKRKSKAADELSKTVDAAVNVFTRALSTSNQL